MSLLTKARDYHHSLESFSQEPVHSPDFLSHLEEVLKIRFMLTAYQEQLDDQARDIFPQHADRVEKIIYRLEKDISSLYQQKTARLQQEFTSTYHQWQELGKRIVQESYSVAKEEQLDISKQKLDYLANLYERLDRLEPEKPLPPLITSYLQNLEKEKKQTEQLDQKLSYLTHHSCSNSEKILKKKKKELLLWCEERKFYRGLLQVKKYFLFRDQGYADLYSNIVLSKTA